MILSGRFIGKILNKEIGSAGVVETFSMKDFPARVMVVINVLPGIKPDYNVKVTWPDGRIISYSKPPFRTAAKPAPFAPKWLRAFLSFLRNL